MSCKLGLWIGDSFAELRGITSTLASNIGSDAVHSRWFLPKKSLSDGLREAIAAATTSVDQLIVATSRTEIRANRRQSTSGIAFLVTAGFESWLKATAPLATPAFSWQPARSSIAVPEDQIFGIAERILPDGTVKTELKLEELEFLVAKLSLSKVTDIPIGFLNSPSHPQHELQAATFLREKGFRVTMSHSLTGTTERERWSLALRLAQADPGLHEICEEIKLAFDGETFFVGPLGLVPIDDVSACTIHGGLERILTAADQEAASAAASSSSSNSKSPARTSNRLSLHFGVERFHLIETSNGSVKAGETGDAGPTTKVSALPVQPTAQIGLSPMMVPSLIGQDRGFEPGPMLFGKSQQLTFLDLLSVRDRLASGVNKESATAACAIEGFDALISERSRSRILESLMTLGKLIPEQSHRSIDALDIANDLELLCIEKIATTLTCAGASGEVNLFGPLARAFEPLLSRRLRQISFRLAPTPEWTLPSSIWQQSTQSPPTMEIKKL